MCHQRSLHFCISFHILVPLALNRFNNMNLKERMKEREGREGEGEGRVGNLAFFCPLCLSVFPPFPCCEIVRAKNRKESCEAI